MDTLEQSAVGASEYVIVSSPLHVTVAGKSLVGCQAYSLILGYLGEPMRLIVPPHQDLVVGYLAEHKVS